MSHKIDVLVITPGMARLMVNGFGIATWEGKQANDSTAEEYATEVARVLRMALGQTETPET